MTTLLIDADTIVHRACYAAERDHKPADEVSAGMVRALMRDLYADRAIAALSDPTRTYFRHKLFADYKPDRSALPANHGDAVAGLYEVALVRSLPGLEGDDVVGILATSEQPGGLKIIVGSDHDLLTIPGLHHRYKNKAFPPGRVVEVSGREADIQHLAQTLIGCSGDGFKGCPGVGKDTWQKVVDARLYAENPARVWQNVVGAFLKAKLTAADALLQARLARICRASDYDLASKSVRLWKPPTAEAPVLPVAIPPTPMAAVATAASSLFQHDGPQRSYTQ